MSLTFFKVLLSLCMFAVAGTTVFAGPPQNFDQANQHFQAGNFAGAAEAYQAEINSGGASAALLYNLGNSQYRMGEFGRAILSYERARLLTPRDPDLLANLSLARKAATVFEKGKYDPRLEAVLDYLSRDEWSWSVADGALWIGLVSIVFGVVRVNGRVVRKSGAVSVGIAVLVIAAGVTALVLRRDESKRGIVLGKEAAVYLSPFENASTLGTPGNGRMVQLGEKNGGYFYVSVPETGLRGWMRGTDVAAIVPEK